MTPPLHASSAARSRVYEGLRSKLVNTGVRPTKQSALHTPIDEIASKARVQQVLPCQQSAVISRQTDEKSYRT